MSEKNQELLKTVQELRKSKVVALVYPRGASIEQTDVDEIYDCLKTLTPTNKIDLVLFSYGGDADAAYKIVKVIREFCKEFNVIIPSEAKSAATLICFGGDKIYMGPVSELGPVDPVVSHPQLPVWVPSRACLKFIEDYVSIISKIPGTENLPIVPVDPIHIGYCRLAIDSAREYATLLLRDYNLKGKDEETIVKIVEKLTSGYAAHSFVIDFSEAQKLGLNVEKMPNDLHDAIWKLYKYYQSEMKSMEKKEKTQVIFETEKGRKDIIKAEPRKLLF